MKLILSIFLAICLSISSVSCVSVPDKWKPVVNSALIIAGSRLVEKNPENAQKLVKFLDKVEKQADEIIKEWTLEDFVKLARKEGLDAEWGVLANAIYEIYKDKLEESAVKDYAAILKGVVQYVRETLLLVVPAK